MDFLKKNWKDALFVVICWAIGFRLLYITNSKIDINKLDFNLIHLAIYILGILLLLLPFFSKVKIGKYLELERKLKETTEELKDFKTEVKQTILTLNSSISTISNLSNQVTINFPDTTQLKNEIEKLKSKGSKVDSKNIEEELILQEEDKILALAKARIQIEYLLRKILNKRISTSHSGREIKYATLTQLVREFLSEYPDYKYLETSFNYTRVIVNSAIHAQKLNEGQIKEGLELSSNLISILRHIAGD